MKLSPNKKEALLVAIIDFIKINHIDPTQVHDLYTEIETYSAIKTTKSFAQACLLFHVVFSCTQKLVDDPKYIKAFLDIFIDLINTFNSNFN